MEAPIEEWQIIQFGKYKGQNFLDILENNKAYCKWLHSQALIMKSNPMFLKLLDVEFKDKNEYYLTFGKYKNKSLTYINNTDKKYITYLKFNDYVNENLQELKNALTNL